MPRPLRIEYEGARYHVLSRGDRREDIVVDDGDRERFIKTLGEAGVYAGWKVHVFCLMRNHFHLVIETPEPTLVKGMQWMLGTFTMRFNGMPKGAPLKVKIAERLHQETPMTLRWIAEALEMGSWRYVSFLLYKRQSGFPDNKV